jgi:hypothetical protein
MHYPISLSAFIAASWRGFPYAEALARMRKERNMPRTENTRRCRAFRPLRSEIYGESKRCADCGKLDPAH